MHIKGIRFGFPPITRLGVLDDRKAHIVRWNSHSGCEIHFMLRGHFTWGIKDSGHRERKVSVSGGSFVVIPPKVQHRADEIREGLAWGWRVELFPPAGVQFHVSGMCFIINDVFRGNTGFSPFGPLRFFPVRERVPLQVTALLEINLIGSASDNLSGEGVFDMFDPCDGNAV